LPPITVEAGNPQRELRAWAGDAAPRHAAGSVVSAHLHKGVAEVFYVVEVEFIKLGK
jgi:hypothetical protein